MRALNSTMLRDALEEHTEDPEVHHNIDTLKHKAVEKRREIERLFLVFLKLTFTVNIFFS